MSDDEDAVPEQPPGGLSEAATLLEFLYLMPVGIVRFRPDGKIDLANPMAAQLLMPVAPGSDLSNLFCVLSGPLPDLRLRVEGFPGPTGSVCDQVQLTVAGTSGVLTLSINKIDPNTFMAVVQDCTRAFELENRIRHDQQRFRAIVENVRDYAIYSADPDGRIDTWNESIARIGGWQAADVLGVPIDRFFSAESADQTDGMSLLHRARQLGAAEHEGWRNRKDGSRFWGSTVAASLPHQGGYVLVARDLTERKQAEDRLLALTMTDPMTGAANRRAAAVKLDDSYRGWQRYGRIFSLLSIDCDHFKMINDRWGHSAGDDALITLVRICRDQLRDADAIFRWGGEEFLVLLPETRQDVGQTVAERLRLALEAATIGEAGREFSMTVSIGVAEVCDFDSGVGDVVRRVDRALYAAKTAGRNQVLVYGCQAAKPFAPENEVRSAEAEAFTVARR